MHAPVKVDNELYVRDYSKCILCYKCVDACGEQYQNSFAIHVAGRGFDARISTEYVAELPESACVYCGNCIAVCPTGALMFLSEHELREAGNWREDEQTVTTTICPYCGVGCNLELHVQDNTIVKVTSPTTTTSRAATSASRAASASSTCRRATPVEMKAGAVVLAGGSSSRMGEAKALLDWHGQTAVEHAVAVVREGIGDGPVCVVRAPGQKLPALDAIVVDDAVAFDGPLAALHVGLVALTGEADVVFACGVDTPLLLPAFVRAVLRTLRKGDDAVVPIIGGRPQPLLAAYRVRDRTPPAGAARRRRLRAAGHPAYERRAPGGRVGAISDPELDAADPRLDSALNANTPEEWAALVAGARRPAEARRSPGLTPGFSRPSSQRREDDLDLAAPDEHRLAVVEDDREPSVGRDRVGRAAPATRPGRAGRGARCVARGHPRGRPSPRRATARSGARARQARRRAHASIERTPGRDPQRRRRERACSPAGRAPPG